MAYKALYRKYRPSTFEDVVGQQHVVVTLQNAIKTNKIAHAYLFCGPRGTGKTSIAKLFAKTINCKDETNRPCGHCSSCVDIQESNHPDVVELDAATYNGVEEIRDIIEKVKYAPLNGKYKVYIIDEVHMMTTNAFNALLKTLEEPPEYCIFILATTEPHKVLPTIISRCQRFDFNKVSESLIKQRLQYIISKEEIHVDDEALNLIANIADGGMRDALSILDQCIAYAQDNITVQDVSIVYGITTVEEKLSIFKHVKEKDAASLVKEINDVAAKGVDIKRLTIDLINLAKEGVVYSYTKNNSMLEIMKEMQAKELTSMFTATELLTYIDFLMDTQSKYREATDAGAYLQVCLLKMVDYKQQPVFVEKVDEKKVETKQVKPEGIQLEISKPIPAKKSVNIKSLDDTAFMAILKVASKTLKEQHVSNYQQLLESKDNPFIVNMLNNATVMAESEKDIILAVQDRAMANSINDIENNKIIETMFEKNYECKKNVIAVTIEYRDYLINYFMTHKDDVVVEEKKEDAVNLEATNKLTALFGEDGFDVVKE